MTIKSISEIKPGHLVEIKSDAGGCDKAPCTKEVMSITDSSFASTDDDDRGYSFKLDMDNYIGTIDVKAFGDKPRYVVHQFAK